MKTLLYNFVQDEQGQDLIEYTLLLAFVCSGFGGAVHRRRRQRVGHLERHQLETGRRQHLRQLARTVEGREPHAPPLIRSCIARGDNVNDY